MTEENKPKKKLFFTEKIYNLYLSAIMYSRDDRF